MNSSLHSESPPADSTAHEIRPRGRLWTLLAAIAVFAWILITISSYILNRLSGEQLSPQAPLQVYQILTDTVSERSCVLPDGRTISLMDSPLLTASDFETFRGWQDTDFRSQLRLHLKTSACTVLQQAQKQHPNSQLAVFIKGSPVGFVRLQGIRGDYLQLTLEYCTAADANEVFARLTQ